VEKNYFPSSQRKEILVKSNGMENFSFLRKFEKLLCAITLGKFIDLDFAVVSFSQGDDSSFWNHSLTNQVLDDIQLAEIEKAMKSLKRRPAIYFENRKDLQPLVSFLEKNDYKFDYEDSWMFWENSKISTNKFAQVKKVTNKNELGIFLKTFDACYQKNDPQNAYGELGDYLKVAERVWHRHNKTDRLEYFVVFKNEKPIAVSSLTNLQGVGYISNVGSLKEVRGKGFGKLATLRCVVSSKEQGNTEHCLATEEGDIC